MERKYCRKHMREYLVYCPECAADNEKLQAKIEYKKDRDKKLRAMLKEAFRDDVLFKDFWND